ncbi:MAG: hypothetical protein ABL903_03985 [Methylococcales bacterium]
MKYADLHEFIEFKGLLKVNDDSFDLNFRARINLNGETEVQFDKLARTRETDFIQNHHYSDDKVINLFSLTGKAYDGTEFMTDDLFFSSMGIESNIKPGALITLETPSCSKATFKSKLIEQNQRPFITMRLRRFEAYRQLDTVCTLGTVVMSGCETEDTDMISGKIKITANEEPVDLKEWKDAVDKLMNHIRYVMSFSSGVSLKAPVMEYYANGQLEVTTWSQTHENLSSLPTSIGWIKMLFSIAPSNRILNHLFMPTIYL